MAPSAWLVLLTDSEDEPCLINLAHVAYIVTHASGATCLTFTSREAILVQQTPEEIARLCAAVSLYAGGEEG